MGKKNMFVHARTLQVGIKNCMSLKQSSSGRNYGKDSCGIHPIMWRPLAAYPKKASGLILKSRKGGF